MQNQFLKKIPELTRETNVSKIYERCINKQLEEYFQALLSENQCGFIIGYGVINALLPMIEKWKKFLDASGAFGALLIYPKSFIVYLLNC